MISPPNPASESAAIITLRADFESRVEGIQQTLDQRLEKISTQQGEIERLSTRIHWLEQQYKLNQAQRFGARSEQA